jgi:FlaG/FlaF family flagellin (archaellin)
LKLGRAKQGQPPGPTVHPTVERKRKKENRLKAVRCRRGISNIIGELLVLAIVVGLMTGVIVFYNGLVNPIQQDYKSTAQQAEDSLKERFLIEDVNFTEGELNVTIYNFGDISISIAAVYINGVMKSPNPSIFIGQKPSSLIGPNQSGWFMCTYTLSNGEVQVKVVTGRGMVAESAFSPS